MSDIILLMKQKLVAPNDPVLIQIAKPLLKNELQSDETKKNIENLLTVSYGHRIDRQQPLVVGLAAPQIGISKRIIAVDIGADGKGNLSNLQICINPEVIKKSKNENEWYEGCWSTDRVCGIVSRPTKVSVSFLTQTGKKVIQSYERYVARIFQHEIDHLNGIEFISHITDELKLHWVEENKFPEYRNKEGWKNWEILCTRSRWEKIKRSNK